MVITKDIIKKCMRIGKDVFSKSENRVNILVECPELIASVKVGILEPLSFLESEGKIHVVFKRTIDITKEDIQWCDILIIVRGYEFVTLQIAEAARKSGRYIIYFLDDDLLGIPENIPSGKHLQNEVVRQTLINIINNSNILWCVNPIIGNKYSSYCNNNYIVAKVPVVLKDIEVQKNSNKVKIIYAGSSDHSETVQNYIVPAVLRICHEYGSNVEFCFIGVELELPILSNLKHMKYIDDYNHYKEIVYNGDFDIGIGIVLNDEFYQSKYYNKFIEYTSIGAVGIYTNSKPYTVVVKDRVNGILCDNDSWYETLKEVIDNEDLRRMCYLNAYKLLEEEYNHTVVGRNLEKLIPELINYRADKKVKVNLTSTRFEFYKQRIFTIWREHRILFLIIILRKLIVRVSKKLLLKLSKK